MDTADVVERFVDAINRGDVEGICRLMTEDHRFIDSSGEVYLGKEKMRGAWIHYYSMVPDYRIEISKILVSGDTVVLFGKASGTYTSDGILKAGNHWEIPAAWRALVDGGKVKEWQIYADLAAVREIIRKEPSLKKVE
jgi:ketosteroid isomerase-like protein